MQFVFNVKGRDGTDQERLDITISMEVTGSFVDADGNPVGDSPAEAIENNSASFVEALMIWLGDTYPDLDGRFQLPTFVGFVQTPLAV